MSEIDLCVVSTITNVSRVKPWREYCRSKIRGITKQEIPWEDIQEGDELEMMVELGHIWFLWRGTRLGHLKPTREAWTVALMGSGYKFRTSILKLTGGTPGKPNRGINILIESRPPMKSGVRAVMQDTNGKLISAEV